MSSVASAGGRRIPIPIPQELSDKAALLAHLGLSGQELKKIWWYRSRMYHQFSIAKSSGKVRLITAPDQRLKMLQSKLASLLDKIYRIRNPVHGFVRSRSVKTNAEAHGRRRYVVNLDIDNFFPSITEKRIYGLLIALDINTEVSEIISHLCSFNNHLPQGAPTSPVLSNMICYRLDSELLEIAKGARAIYTRYADDITFSSYQPPSPLFEGALPAVGRFSPEVLAPRLRVSFHSNGFKINTEKSHYADRNSRRIVTGVKINSGLNVDRRYVRRIRALLHSVERLGYVASQAKYAQAGGKGSLAAHLRGKISFVSHLKGLTDPVVRALALRYNQNFGQHPIKLTPTEEERRDRSVWIVEHSGNGGEQGTAFFLKGVGLVTAAHCVEGANDIIVFHPAKAANSAKVTVARECKHRDLAILSHAISGTEYYELEATMQAVVVNSHVTAYGYPGYGPGDKVNVRTGTVTSLPVKNLVQKIEVTQELTQGMSGGPILDVNGEVVGIVHKGGPDEGRQLATHISVLLQWISE